MLESRSVNRVEHIRFKGFITENSLQITLAHAYKVKAT